MDIFHFMISATHCGTFPSPGFRGSQCQSLDSVCCKQRAY